jgi:hypothetical protein
MYVSSTDARHKGRLDSVTTLILDACSVCRYDVVLKAACLFAHLSIGTLCLRGRSSLLELVTQYVLSLLI